MPKWKRPVTITYADGTSETVSGAHFQRASTRRRRRTKAQRAHWHQRRKQALARDRHRCQDCGRAAGDADDRLKAGRPTTLEVHHLTYGRWGAELLADLVTLCQRCHASRHQQTRREAEAAAL